MSENLFLQRTAFVACNGDCNEQNELQCMNGCIGCGICEASCASDAVHVDPQKGVAKVDEDKCTGCGICVESCPKQVIRIRDRANFIFVECSNNDPGAVARKMCKVGCIGCGVCERNCPAGAVKVIDNLARIDDEICLSCGMCAVKCPRTVIHDSRKVLTD